MAVIGGVRRSGARFGDPEAFLDQLCAELTRDPRSAAYQLALLPGRPVRGFDGELLAGLGSARWSRRAIVWGHRETLEIVDEDGSLLGIVTPLPEGGWGYELAAADATELRS